MAEPFKNLINPDTVQAIATQLSRVAPAFPAGQFARLALPGLQALELKARAHAAVRGAAGHAAGTTSTSPPAWLEAALAPPRSPATGSDDLVDGAPGLVGLGAVGGRRVCRPPGIDHPQRALQALHAITQRFTAEWALRPFVLRHPQITFATLARWVDDPSEHVRRLVSEGTRPRLPWGLQLKTLIDDPSPTLPLLRALQDDASDYVRRSVANHLNDIAKDHPELVASWVHEHLDRCQQRAARAAAPCQPHADQARPCGRRCSAWGLGKPLRGEASLEGLAAARQGGRRGAVDCRVEARRALAATAGHRLRAAPRGGQRQPGAQGLQGLDARTSRPARRSTLLKRHSLREVTTRRLYAGRHEIELQVNGRSVARAAFRLSAP